MPSGRNTSFALLIAALAVTITWIISPETKSALLSPSNTNSSVSRLISEKVAAQKIESTSTVQSDSNTSEVATSNSNDRVQSILNSGRVLETTETQPDSLGRFKRITVVETDMKYPHLRVEANHQLMSDTGEEVLLEQNAMVADHLLIRLQDDVDLTVLETYAAEKGLGLKQFVPGQPLYIVQLQSFSIDGFDSVLNSLSSADTPAAYAEPDYIVYSLANVNDPSFWNQWALNNVGQIVGKFDADIDAPEAWEFSVGSSNVIVGVIDTGVDLLHEELIENLWVNSNEVVNGIDDDGNGYIDDIHGWDFHNLDSSPMDEEGHGTHCAGIIGAEGNNGIGVTGVCQEVSIMALQFLDRTGKGSLSDAVSALYYATQNGAFITSNSWGGGGYSYAMADAISDANNAGAIFVAAAGNESRSNDERPIYPASYPLDNIISVAASSRNDELTSYSNFGLTTVDIAAPGEGIYSTHTSYSGYSTLSGTSMAAPHVAGAAALLKSARPNMLGQEIIEQILSSVDTIPDLDGKVASGGRLNVNAAIRSIDGAYLTHVASTFIEESGNGNESMNPGESFRLGVSMKNIGVEALNGVTATLSLSRPIDDVIIVKASSNFGTIGAGETKQNLGDEFIFSFKEDVETPNQYTLKIELSDSEGETWEFEQWVNVYSSNVISGNIKSLSDDKALSHAHVYYWGNANGEVEVDEFGNFSFEILDGNYEFHIVADGYVNSKTFSVDAISPPPPFDIKLGRSMLDIGTDEISSSQLQDSQTVHQITISNLGDVPLHYTADVLSGSCNLEGAVAPLFESWESETQKPISDQYASTGSNSHYSHSPNESRDAFGYSLSYRTTRLDVKSIAFWVRPIRPTPSSPWSGIISVATDTRDYNNSNLLFDYNTSNLLSHENYNAERWFHLEFKNFDYGTPGYFGGRSCEVYVNGEFHSSLEMMSFTKNHIGGIRKIIFGNERGGESYVDDIHIEFDDLSWVDSSARGKRLSLEPGESATIQVAVDSTDIAPGVYEMQLRIGSNDPLNGSVFVPISVEVIELPNSPPVTVDILASGDEDTEIVIDLQGVDPDGNPFDAWITEMPSKGKLYQYIDDGRKGERIREPSRVTDTNRRVIYLPTVNENGQPYDSFKFVLRDKRSESLEANVDVNIQPINDSPVARNDSIGAAPGETIESFNVLKNDVDPDGDSITLLSYTSPNKGQLIHLGSGIFRYIPDSAFLGGSDSFSYTVEDPDGALSTAYVMIRYDSFINGDWSMEGRNISNNAYYPGDLNNQQFREVWEFDDGSYEYGEAAIGGEKVYLGVITQGSGTRQHSIQAISVATGQVAWEHHTELGNSFDGQPVIAEGLVVYQRLNYEDREQILYALDSATGESVWESILPYSSDIGVPRIADGKIYLKNHYKFLLIDLETGDLEVTRELVGYPDEWVPVKYNSEVYVSSDGILYAYDHDTLNQLWTLSLVDETYTDNGASIVCDSGIALIRHSSEVIAVDLSTRRVKWRIPCFSTSDPVVSNGIMYISHSGRYIGAYSMTDGSSIDVYNVSSYDATDLIVTDDTLIASAWSSHIWVFNISTGTLIQTIDYGGNLSFSNGGLAVTKPNTRGLRFYALSSSLNPMPVAQSEEFLVHEDTDTVIRLRGQDSGGDILFATLCSLPDKGSLFQTQDGVNLGAEILQVPTRVEHQDMKLIYRPPANHFGDGFSSFEFKVNDGTYFSDTGVATISVSNKNDPPLAFDDRVELIDRFGQIRFNPLYNDYDLDGDGLSVSSFTQPQFGTVSLNGMQFTYQGDGAQEYTDTFSYTIEDPFGLSSSATVTVIRESQDVVVWEMAGSDASRDGYIPVRFGLSLLEEKWNLKLPGNAQLPAISEKLIYITPEPGSNSSFRNEIHSIDRITGGNVWHTDLSNSSSARTFSAPVYSDGVLLSSNQTEGTLISLNSTTGSTLWEVAAGYETYGVKGPVVADDIIWADKVGYVPNVGDGLSLEAFRIDSGQKVRELLLDEDWYNNRNFLPYLTGGRLLSPVKDRMIRQDSYSGEVEWEEGFGSANMASNGSFGAVIERIDAFEVEIVVFDLSSGSVAWRLSGEFEEYQPALTSQMVFCAMKNGIVNAYELSSGILVRTYDTGGRRFNKYQPLVTDDRLFVEGWDSIYVFDLLSATLLQEIPHNGKLAIVDDLVLLSCDDSFLRAYSVPDIVNSAPIPVDFSLSVLEDSSIVIALEASDAEGDTISYLVPENPVYGKLFQIDTEGNRAAKPIELFPAAVLNPDGLLGYAPLENQFGIGVDQFNYKAADMNGLSGIATIQISLEPVQDPPVARNDFRGTKLNEDIENLRLTLNDYDADGDTLSITSFTQPDFGIISQNADGSLRYSPSSGNVEADTSFSYTVSDGSGGFDTADVVVSILHDMGQNWTSDGNSSGRDSYSNILHSTDPFLLDWSVPIPQLDSYPVIEGASAFVINRQERKVSAFDINTGELLWSESPGTHGHYPQPLTVEQGKIYLETGQSLVAMDALNGETIWEVLVPGATSPGGPVCFLGGEYGELWVLNRAYNGKMYAYDLENGNPTIIRDVGRSANWHLSEYDSFLYGIWDDTFHCIDPYDGDIVWSLSDERITTIGSLQTQTACITSEGAFLVDKNEVRESGEPEYELVCIDLDSRSVRWTRPVWSLATPASEGGEVYVNYDNTIHAYSASDGKLLFEYTVTNASTGPEPVGDPVISNTLLISSSSTKTFIWERFSGRLLQVLPHGGKVSVSASHIVISGDDDILYAYKIPDLAYSPPAETESNAPIDLLLYSDIGGADLYYTLDQSEPNSGSRQIADDGIVRLHESAIIKVVLVKGGQISATYEAPFTVSDIDIDGLPDWWELNNFGLLSIADARTDVDGDGELDIFEWKSGTDPLDSNSFLSMNMYTEFIREGIFSIDWDSVSDRFYRVNRSRDLIEWVPASNWMQGSGDEINFSDTFDSLEEDCLFYQIQVQP